MSKVKYAAVIHKEDTSDYGVSFPDFPGCVTAGSTLDEAYAMAKEALQFHIDGLVEDGEKFPSPFDFSSDYIHAAEDVYGVIFIEVNIP